jgi:DNA processing protein
MQSDAPGPIYIARDDPRYPARLLEIDGAPSGLWAAGRIELLQAPAIAVVGSRNCSFHGREDAELFARCFARAGFCVVSGLALGVDAAAHEGALAENGSSIAVLGTGIDLDYPKGNKALAQALRTYGCVITEFDPGTPPRAGNFPQRNRIISGLSLGVLVVEAADRSGSLITARQAAEQGRDVFAIPGSIHSPLAKGCHKVIREGAKLVDTPAHVLESLGWKGAAHGEVALFDESPAGDDSGDVTAILKALGNAPMSMDQVVIATGLPARRIAAELSLLEVSQRVCSLPGGWFQRALPGNR